MGTRPGISAFFPAYNDAGTIASMVITTLSTLEQLTDDYEVIVVNDGSEDHTALVLEELAAREPRLRIVDHGRNRGYGAALRSGFAAATKELIFYTDGDAQYDPRELALLVPALKADVDIVNGYKIARSDPLHRKLIGRVYHHAMKLAFGFRLRDVDCDFRLIRRKVFETISLESNSGAICLELVKKLQDAGFRFAEVPVHHYHRVYGKSQFFNVRRLLRTFARLAVLWWKLVVRQQHRRAGDQAVLLIGKR